MTERKRESLLDWAEGQPPALPDPQELALRASFEHARTQLSGEQEQDGAALLRYFGRLNEAWNAAGYLRDRAWAEALLGAYFDFGMHRKRGLGRPKSRRACMFACAWHEMNLDLTAAGSPPLRPTVPAREIAAEIARRGWGSFTPQQISSALAKAPEWRDRVLSANYGEKSSS